MKKIYWFLIGFAIVSSMMVSVGISSDWNLYYMGLAFGGIVAVGGFLILSIFYRYRKGISHNSNPYR